MISTLERERGETLMLSSICSKRRCILAWVKFQSRVLTALNLLPSIATLASIEDRRRWRVVSTYDEDGKNYISDESERYDRPLMAAVSAPPRQDLAKIAEALVSLTAFLKRMAADQDETVAEPINVAILSKGDGFIWVKHKDLIRQAEGLAL